MAAASEARVAAAARATVARAAMAMTAMARTAAVATARAVASVAAQMVVAARDAEEEGANWFDPETRFRGQALSRSSPHASILLEPCCSSHAA